MILSVVFVLLPNTKINETLFNLKDPEECANYTESEPYFEITYSASYPLSFNKATLE